MAYTQILFRDGIFQKWAPRNFGIFGIGIFFDQGPEIPKIRNYTRFKIEIQIFQHPA